MSTHFQAKVYGFVAANQAVQVQVESDGSDGMAAYTVPATVSPWVNTSGGCMPMLLPNGTMAGCSDPRTPTPPVSARGHKHLGGRDLSLGCRIVW